ncbi:YcaO-like family protein [Shimia sp. MIT1388]|uniref:YcaO-like family protein n=1 Tax=Shimia sp. MIT1388 TaxID=3096992 RepID=UPI00399A2E60
MFTALREFERPLGGEMALPEEVPAFCRGVLAQLDYVFVGCPKAVPKMVVAGGVLPDGTPVSGAGASSEDALVRLAGEAAEQLGLRQAVLRLPCDRDIPALDLGGSEVVQVAREVLPLSSSETAGFSEGLAAHTDWETAVLHGALELFERDAAAHWWGGATQATLLTEADAQVLEALGARPERQTRVLDVTCDTGVPVVVAVSFDLSGGEFCFGAAAGASLEGALGSALRELGAAEFGRVLERSRGGESDDAGSRRSVDTLTLQLLETQMVGQSTPLRTQVLARNAIARGEWPSLIQENGIGIVDLGCVGGQFRVIKAVSAALQPGRETHVCPRFQAALLGTERRTQGSLY